MSTDEGAAHARGNFAQRFVHLPGGFEPPTPCQSMLTLTKGRN